MIIIRRLFKKMLEGRGMDTCLLDTSLDEMLHSLENDACQGLARIGNMVS